MLVSKIVKCRIVHNNKKRLKSLGYDVEGVTEVEVLIKDLMPSAIYPVEVQCDYCEKIIIKQYYMYAQSRKKFPKDCCVTCIPKKQAEMRDVGLIVLPKSNPKLRRREIDQVIKEFDAKGYDLLDKEYINNQIPMSYICRKHSDKGVQKIAYGQFFRNRGCVFCGRESSASKQKYSIEQVKNIIENEYKDDCCKLISDTYVDSMTQNLVIKCKCGNHFTTSLSVFRKATKKSCEFCKQSEGASNVQKFLEDNSYIFKKEKTFKNLKSDIEIPLRFDFALMKSKKVSCLIEYDGEFHYKKFYKGQEFERQQIHDSLKNEYCIKNNIPLIRIPYWEKDNISEILTDIFICKNLNSKFIVNNNMGVCEYG